MVKNAILRGSIPFIIFGVMALFLYIDGDIETAQNTFIATIIFTLVSAASIIYDLDQWSVFKRSLIHFLVMLITIYPILVVSGWFEMNTISDYLVVFLLFFGVGLILWGIALGIVTLLGKKS
ncbi:DUF3021 family protein [Gracilibacillus sp. S3-1-1]|uniref:DUF3021 family protein n=1 Tax=Gracilibacillus pellucidus TaxID=3095368 RepID=A0ACC6M5Y1_9BACI|nr:DUF3021 family protein [Gracilibacillus sp. S3-1-1]MDX8046278.1 DUF3021 family protein [Gracilibacillus sp. S3-1-1]